MNVNAIKKSELHIVLVKHNMNSDKEYVFKVPMELTPYLKKDIKVKVSTKMGVVLGITTTNVVSGGDAIEVIKKNNACFPLKKVLYVSKTMNLNEIIVSQDFKNAFPCSYKIRKCYEYYIKKKKFDRDIVINQDDLLVDGYVAYLITKMLGIQKLEVMMKGL